MNLSFKKRWLYIFSNKKAQASNTGMSMRTLILLIVALMISAFLIVMVFNIVGLIGRHSP
jgi:hypothetical protein